ncbi:MAG: FtsW/RodA/SpoVE family cell cycle protein, partial [Eubacterium sp.]|nr:FtsW/RodA/SpoVE family cell cycle protein [Candidatus Colimonas fimequi]
MEFLDNALEITKIYFTTGVRWVFVFLAFYILVRQIRSLIQARNPSEIWAYLGCPDGTSVPLTHWENLLGRGRGCDVVINLNSVSRSHGTLIRDSQGVWRYDDLRSKNGSLVNGMPVNGPTEVKGGDVLTIGGSDFALYPVSLQERMANIAKRKKRTKNVSPWPSMFALTLFQFLAVVQFKVSLGEEFPGGLIPAFALLCATMWAYLLIMKSFKRIGFEMEIIAFFLCTLSLSVTTSAYPSTVLKQSICVVLGVILFFGMCWLLRDLNRTKKMTYIFIGLSVVLLIINLTMGSFKYGATNWVSIAGFTIQPSELVKIVFIFVGAGTLDELQKRKNMLIFVGFSVFCLGCLAIMGDFGTAIIFFVTYLVISFLRSGDFSRLLLVVGAAGLMGMMVLRFKPYIANRFAAWGHVWDDPTDSGYQQVQAMCSTASGGLPGLGAGNGTLSDVGAAPTDLVFCLVSEEWGLIIAILAVVCIVTLGVFAVRSIIAGRSTYYSIAACGAMTMFMFQTILNVFGTVDLLPLTGVTFP